MSKVSRTERVNYNLFEKRRKKEKSWAYTDHITFKPLKNSSPNKYFFKELENRKKMSSSQMEFPPEKGAESKSDKCVWSDLGEGMVSGEADSPDGLKVPSVSIVYASTD